MSNEPPKHVCPKCGGNGVEHRDYVPGFMGRMCYVQCDRCGARTKGDCGDFMDPMPHQVRDWQAGRVEVPHAPH